MGYAGSGEKEEGYFCLFPSAFLGDVVERSDEPLRKWHSVSAQHLALKKNFFFGSKRQHSHVSAFAGPYPSLSSGKKYPDTLVPVLSTNVRFSCHSSR